MLQWLQSGEHVSTCSPIYERPPRGPDKAFRISLSNPSQGSPFNLVRPVASNRLLCPDLFSRFLCVLRVETPLSNFAQTVPVAASDNISANSL